MSKLGILSLVILAVSIIGLVMSMFAILPYEDNMNTILFRSSLAGLLLAVVVSIFATMEDEKRKLREQFSWAD